MANLRSIKESLHFLEQFIVHLSGLPREERFDLNLSMLPRLATIGAERAQRP